MSIPEDLAQTISKIDTDGSGYIEYSEFIAATLTKKQYEKTDVLWNAFKVFDIDGDAFITVDEVAQILKQKEVNPDIASSIIAEADQDGDGKVSFDEFKDMMGEDLDSIVGSALS